VELKNIAPPPVSNFETLTATPRPGKDNRAKYGITFEAYPVDPGLGGLGEAGISSTLR